MARLHGSVRTRSFCTISSALLKSIHPTAPTRCSRFREGDVGVSLLVVSLVVFCIVTEARERCQWLLMSE